jgi:6-phosphogluconolactonase
VSLERAVLPTAQAAAEACARRIAELLDGALRGVSPSGLPPGFGPAFVDVPPHSPSANPAAPREARTPRATLAISGGSSPKPMFDGLARAAIPWDRVHIFWVDERCVPPTDDASNYRSANERLIAPAGIPESNVHRIQGELDPHAAAALYEEQVRVFFGLSGGELPRFDIVHRGIGADAHTASLFPGQSLIETGKGVAAPVFAPQFNQWRVTLLPGVLEAARNTVILATGADKAEAVRAVFNEPYDPVKFPAQIAARQAAWFLDGPAARLL